MTRSLLIVGNFGIGALEHQYVKHLKKLNWEVYTFEIQAPVQALKNKNIITKIGYRIAPYNFFNTVNEHLVSFAKRIKPLATIVFKGMEIFPETLVEIKKHTKLLCNYNPDHPFDFHSKGSGNKNVKAAIGLYDFYGTYSTRIADSLKEVYKANSFVLPFGFDTELNLPKQETTTNKFGFIGAFDKDRLSFLVQLRDFPIEVYGENKWVEKTKKLNNSNLFITGKPLFNYDYVSYCGKSMGIFNFLRAQNLIEQSHNMRTFEVPGYGGVLIANRTEEQLSFFEEDKEAIYFNDIYELKDKLNFLIKHPEQLSLIKINAYKRASNSNYSYLYRSKELSHKLETWLK